MTKKEFENKFNASLEALSGRKNEVYIVIEGDMNDADYITETSTFDIKDFEEYFPVIKAIYEGRLENSGEQITEKEVKFLEKIEYGDDLYNDIVPRGEYGCHSICIEELKFFDENGAEYDIKLKGE